MKIEINTTKFEWSHGRKPRGRGDWAFEIAGVVFWANGAETYREACEFARMKAREKNVRVAFVCP